MTDPIAAWIQANRDAVLEALGRLVSIDTQNLAPEGREQPGQMAVAAMLRMLDCEVDVYEISSVPGLLDHPQYWPRRPGTGRPNVIGIRRGAGGGRSLLFSSHIDTVPVGVDPWSKAPWGGEISDGRLWGLGAYDMKGGLIASIMALKALKDMGVRLKGDLMVESVIDEEYGGCNGTLAARLKYNADLAVVPEPTNLIVCPAHQGGLMLRVIFHGKPGWTFSPEKPIDPVNAIARFITLLNEWVAERGWQPPAIYQNNPALSAMINQLKAGDVAHPFFADRIPSSAWLTAWISVYPGMTQEQVMGELQTYYRHAQQQDPVLAEFQPEWEPIRFLSGSQIPADHPGVQAFAAVATQVRGQTATVQGAPFACDGHMFNLHSPTPLLLLGPNGGGPHSPDEFVYTNDYLHLVEIFVRGAMEWCGVA
jgi:acetylornithine deacetylase